MQGSLTNDDCHDWRIRHAKDTNLIQCPLFTFFQRTDLAEVFLFFKNIVDFFIFFAGEERGEGGQLTPNPFGFFLRLS